MKIKLYTRSSPNALHFVDVDCLTTEGGLMRIVSKGVSTWFPLCEVFKVVQE